MKVATRTVVLLGRHPSLTVDDLRTNLRQNDELVVRSLGYPVTATQRDLLLRAQDLAAEVGAWVDATLVFSIEAMLDGVRPDDTVHVAARGLQGRRLRRALRLSHGRNH